jgi:hypothetical protein
MRGNDVTTEQGWADEDQPGDDPMLPGRSPQPMDRDGLAATLPCPTRMERLDLHSSTAAAALSRKSEQSQMHVRTILTKRWPVCGMLARSLTPAWAAVARPARQLLAT